MEPKDRAGYQLFQTFKRNAPGGIIPNGPTVQGVYCMTPDGDYLSGYFAWAFKNRALGVIENGWSQFERIASQRGWSPQPVPTNSLNHTLGKPVESGGLKLEVAVRDLPRGRDMRPGANAFQRAAYNVSWVDFTATEARQFVTEETDKQKLPQSMLDKLSETLKDCVRGQASDWKKGQRDGEILTQCIQNDSTSLVMRITGYADLSKTRNAYACQIHGTASFDKRRQKFTDFRLVASGQRSGKYGANDRQNDLGPAPMGVAYSMFVDSERK